MNDITLLLPLAVWFTSGVENEGRVTGVFYNSQRASEAHTSALGKESYIYCVIVCVRLLEINYFHSLSQSVSVSRLHKSRISKENEN